MNKIEKLFDINILLMSLFSSLESIRDEQNIELIYDMGLTIPKELRGNPDVLHRLLKTILTFVFEHTEKKEIVLSLDAPEDFLYEEPVSFRIKETDIAKDKILEFLENHVKQDLEILDGKIVHGSESDIHVDIPLMVNELGFRRHYRLPDNEMVGKKVLLICESEEVARSIKHMFEYFLYEVDVGLEAFKKGGNDLTPYDILIVEESLNTEKLEHSIAKVQQKIPLKYVLLQESHADVNDKHILCVSTHLIKPVTEESIYELILSIFKHTGVQRKAGSSDEKNIVDLEKALGERNEKQTAKKSESQGELHTLIEMHRVVKLPVLDREIGEENAKNMGLKYPNELKKFLDSFDRSDLYFREIVNEKAINKIKEFCIDLEKQAKLIGAQSMLKFAEIVSLIFVYDKLDMLPIYPGKYHIELQKLIEEIKKELHLK